MSVIPSAPPIKSIWLTAATDAMVSDKVVTAKNQWCNRSVSAGLLYDVLGQLARPGPILLGAGDDGLGSGIRPRRGTGR